MKTITLTIGFCLLIQFIYAQTNKIEINGNVGIGTTNPIGKLQIINTVEDANGTTLILGNIDGPNLRMGYNTDYNWIQSHGGRPLRINDLGNDLILNPTAGNIGAGTINPVSKLDIRGNTTSNIYGVIIPTVNIFTNDAPQIGAGPAIALGGKTGNANPEYAFAYITGGKETSVSNNYAGYFSIRTVSAGGGENNEISSANYERLRVSANGNVGIGTIAPKEKLSVNGKIRAQEIKVETQNWPDYVFKKTYKPMSLSDLEAYIKKNEHLPDFPSAQQAETDGVDLGNLNKILIKHQEELTLHLIEQNKKIELLIQLVQKQQVDIDKLKSKNSKSL